MTSHVIKITDIDVITAFNIINISYLLPFHPTPSKAVFSIYSVARFRSSVWQLLHSQEHVAVNTKLRSVQEISKRWDSQLVWHYIRYAENEPIYTNYIKRRI